MAIQYVNNWLGNDEFVLINIAVNAYHKPEQLGILLCFMGLGVVIIINQF